MKARKLTLPTFTVLFPITQEVERDAGFRGNLQLCAFAIHEIMAGGEEPCENMARDAVVGHMPDTVRDMLSQLLETLWMYYITGYIPRKSTD